MAWFLLHAAPALYQGNIEAIWQNSAVAANYSDALSLSLWAGMDQSFDSPGNGFDTSKMYPAIAEGLVNKSWVDRACASKCYFVD